MIKSKSTRTGGPHTCGSVRVSTRHFVHSFVGSESRAVPLKKNGFLLFLSCFSTRSSSTSRSGLAEPVLTAAPEHTGSDQPTRWFGQDGGWWWGKSPRLFFPLKRRSHLLSQGGLAVWVGWVGVGVLFQLLLTAPRRFGSARQDSDSVSRPAAPGRGPTGSCSGSPRRSC